MFVVCVRESQSVCLCHTLSESVCVCQIEPKCVCESFCAPTRSDRCLHVLCVCVCVRARAILCTNCSGGACLCAVCLCVAEERGGAKVCVCVCVCVYARVCAYPDILCVWGRGVGGGGWGGEVTADVGCLPGPGVEI